MDKKILANIIKDEINKFSDDTGQCLDCEIILHDKIYSVNCKMIVKGIPPKAKNKVRNFNFIIDDETFYDKMSMFCENIIRQLSKVNVMAPNMVEIS